MITIIDNDGYHYDTGNHDKGPKVATLVVGKTREVLDIQDCNSIMVALAKIINKENAE